jgi:pimeloyl-ACP methyl ester carboxylesterase
MITGILNNEGGEIAYEELGSGTPVICVPGMGDLRAEYRFLAPQLAAAGLRAVSMDVRGHGQSSVDWNDYSVAGVGRDIIALIRCLDAGPAFVVGTSMAAGAAVFAAAEAPEIVRGLALLGPAVHGEPTWHTNLLYGAMFARPWGPALWLTYFNMLYPTRKPADFTEYRAALKANLSQPGRLEALKKMMLASKSASEQRLPKVKAPALVLMGSKDPDFKPPEAEAQWVAGRLNARYEMIPSAGHYPQAEMPEITGPKVVAFLRSIHAAHAVG